MSKRKPNPINKPFEDLDRLERVSYFKKLSDAALNQLDDDVLVLLPVGQWKRLTPERQAELWPLIVAKLRPELNQIRAMREADRKQRAELAGDGDDSYERMLLELREETGLDIATIDNGDARKVHQLLRVAIRKRRAKRAEPEEWVTIEKAKHFRVRSTAFRNANKPGSGVRLIDDKYSVLRTRLREWITESCLKKYLKQ